ncbi:MAG: TIGR01906 family membrane protein [Chloroflexi bacterium]|nr:TIGR01906 family membrane protein [Chloroflexota bacterium]
MRIAGIIARWLFILIFPLLLMTGTIAVAFNSQPLYEYGFKKYGISQVTGLAPAELTRAAKGLVGYFNSGEEFINLTVIKDGRPFQLFNQREVGHLKDVKKLVRLDYNVLLGTGLFALVYAGVSLFRQRRKHWQQLAGAVFTGSAITLGIMLLLGVGSMLNFEGLFLQFHLLSFTNDLWQLDPSRDYLIMLFPGGFWYDAALFCGIFTTVLAVALGGVTGIYLRRARRSKPST